MAHRQRRNTSRRAVAMFLRAAMHLPLDERAPGEVAATLGRPPPDGVEGLDAGAWIAWCLVGLRLFEGPLPRVESVRTEAVRAAMVLAMYGADGHLTTAARVLGISRHALREGLRAFGLYPWPGDDDAEHSDIEGGDSEGSDGPEGLGGKLSWPGLSVVLGTMERDALRHGHGLPRHESFEGSDSSDGHDEGETNQGKGETDQGEDEGHDGA